MTFPYLRWQRFLEHKLCHSRRPEFPLHLVLTVPFVLLTVGTTGLVGYLSWQNGQSSVNSLANQLMAEVSDRISLYLNNYLETPHLINRLNVRATRLKLLNLRNPKDLERNFLRQIQEFNSVRIHFSNPQGGLVGAGNDERGLTVSSTDNFVRGTLHIHSVDSQGKQIKRLVNRKNYDASQRPFHQQAVAAGKPIWTPVYTYVPASRGLGIAASYPLYNQAHQLQGVFSSDLTLVAISDFLKKLRVGTHGQVFIMERSGLMIAASRSEQALLAAAAGEKTNRLKAAETQEPLIRLTAQHLLAQFGSFDRIDTAKQLHFNLEGKKQFLLVTPYKEQLGLDWLIVAVVPESDFMAQVYAGTYTTVLLSAGALAGAIALGLWLSQRIVRPIRQFAQASSALADGEWNQSIGQGSHIAELQMLNNSFNRMAVQLQQSFDQVQTALQESEENFTKVFRTSPDPIGLVTLDGYYLEVNDAFVNLLGYSREEVIGHTATELGHWVNLDDRESYVRAVLSDKQIRNQEFLFRNKRGQLLTVLFSAEHIELQGLPYIIKIFKDISDRKQAEMELQEQKDLRETIYNESADALFLVDPETLLITDCNRRAAELFEVDNKVELIGIEGRTLQRYPFSAAEVDEIVAEMQQQGFWSREVEYMTRKGNLFWGNLTAKSVQIAAQTLHLVQVKDITDRKHAEEALRQNEARFQQLAAASPAIIYTVEEYPGRPVRFEYISPAFEEIHEVPLADVLENAMVAFDAFHPDDREGHQQAVLRALETMQPFSHEWRIITPSGKIKWIQGNSRPERRKNEELVWHGVVIEVTELKQAEAALRQSEERTRAILTAIPDLMKLYSIDGIYLDTIKSDSTRDLIPDDKTLFGKHLFELVPSDVAEKQLRLMQQAAATGEVQVYEQQVWLQESLQYEEVRIVPCANNTALLLIRDITARKQTEEALRRSESALRRAQRVAHVGSWELDFRTEKVTWSEESFHIFGWDTAQLEPTLTQFLELVHPDDRALLWQNVEQAKTTGIFYNKEFRIIQPDGLIRYVETRGEVIVDQGQPVQLLGTNLDITDRVLTEAALRQSEARFQKIATASPAQIYILTYYPDSLEMRFEYISEGVREIQELEPDQVLENSLLTFEQVHPDDRDLYNELTRQSFRTLQPFTHEWRIITPSGKTKWVRANSRPEKRENGEIAWYGVLLDVTERKLIEEALRQSEATKNQILKAIPDLIIWMNADGTCIDLVDGSSVNNLYRKSDAIGSNLYDLLPFELARAREQAIAQALQTGDDQIYEQQVTVQERIYHEEVRVVGVGEDRVLVIVRDITSRKQAEAALRDSEERFRSAFHDAPIGLAMIGLDERWLKVNPMLCDMLGYSEPEVLAMSALALVHPEDIDKLQHCVEQVLTSENRNAQVELRYFCNEGRTAWGLVSLSLVRDTQNEPLYYVAQIQDITEQQAIDRMKDEFISIVSHELRTPLTAIKGFLGLLNTGVYANRPEKAKRMLEQALENSDRLVRLVNDILDLERLASGKAQLVMEVCDAESLIKRAVEGVRSIADQACVMLEVTPTSAQVWAAPDSIIQTLTNLLSNAIKFSPQISVVTLSAHVAHSQSEFVLFQVKDQGRGIPPDKLETIFGRFQQVDVSDSRQKGGTGLGLAICQSIVQQHGGNIWAESTINQGSTFYFTLPMPPKGDHD